MKLEYVNQTNIELNINDVMKNVLHISSRLCGKLKRNNCICIQRKNVNFDEITNTSIQIKDENFENIANDYLQKKFEKNSDDFPCYFEKNATEIEKAKMKNILQKGDKLIINLDYSEDVSNIIPVDKPIEILYEDDFLLAVNKPPFMPVHPSMNHFTDSLSNLVRAYFDKNKLHKKTRPVNRLDRNTSGIVVFAKNEYVQEMLIQQMKENKFKKKYIAFVYDNGLQDSGIINKSIGRKKDSIIERTTNENELMPGYKMESAITEYKVLSRFNNIAKVECNLKTRKNSSNKNSL